MEGINNNIANEIPPFIMPVIEMRLKKEIYFNFDQTMFKTAIDLAIYQLNRPVNRKPIRVNTQFQYENNKKVFVIGYPLGIMQKVGTNMSQFDKAFPSYNSAGSDFFLNLGSNILSAPGGNPILQTLGTAAREPLLQMQKTNMAQSSSDRELITNLVKNLDD